MAQTGTGADALLGFVVDGPSDLYSAGHCGISTNVLAAPTVVPTSAASVAAGALTGSFLYKYAWRKKGGFITSATGPSTPALVVTAKDIDVGFAASADTANVDATLIYRSSDGGTTYGLVHTAWDPTDTTWTDSVLEANVDYTVTPRTVNESSGNWGLAFVDPDSFDLAPSFAPIAQSGLSGSPVQSRGIPGPIKIGGTMKRALRSGSAVHTLTALLGQPVRAEITGEPTRTYTWTASTVRRLLRTITGFSYQGTTGVTPEWLYQLVADELDLAFADGKVIEDTTKFTGLHCGLSGPATKISGAGTYAGTFIAMGQRFDAASATAANVVRIKITQALSGGTWKFKPMVVNGTTYTDEVTAYYDTDSSRQTKGGTQYADVIELTDASSNRLGADSGSNRFPYVLLATAPLTGIAVDDIYEIPITSPIPGTGSAPYTGVPAKLVNTPIFTDAHVTIAKAGTVMETMSATLKLTSPKKAINALGPGARTDHDWAHDGYFGAQLALTRGLNDRTWDAIMRADTRAVVTVTIEGERIVINKGATLSTHRESIVFTFNQMRVSDTKSPVGGVGMISETATLDMEQPDDSATEAFTVVVTTRQDVTIPTV